MAVSELLADADNALEDDEFGPPQALIIDTSGGGGGAGAGGGVGGVSGGVSGGGGVSGAMAMEASEHDDEEEFDDAMGLEDDDVDDGLEFDDDLEEEEEEEEEEFHDDDLALGVGEFADDDGFGDINDDDDDDDDDDDFEDDDDDDDDDLLAYEALASQKRSQNKSKKPRADAMDADPGGSALASIPKRTKRIKKGRRRSVSTGIRLPRHLPERVVNALGHSNLLLGENKLQEAFDAVSDVIKEFPILPEAFEQLSIIWELMGDAQKAFETQKLCISILNPRSMHAHGYNQISGDMDARALMNAEVGNATQLGVSQTALNSWRRYANLAVKTGDYVTALNALQQIIKLDPEDDDTRWDQAMLYNEQLGRPTRAVTILEEMRERRPTDVTLLTSIARLNHQIGKHDKATEAVQAGLQAIVDSKGEQMLDLTIVNMLAELRMERAEFGEALALISAADAACAMPGCTTDEDTGHLRLSQDANARLAQGWKDKQTVSQLAKTAYAQESDTASSIPLDLQVKAGVCCVYLDTGGQRAERCLRELAENADSLIERIAAESGSSAAAADEEHAKAPCNALYADFADIKDLLADASDAYMAIDDKRATMVWTRRLYLHVPSPSADVPFVAAPASSSHSLLHSAHLIAKGASNLLRCGDAAQAAHTQHTALELSMRGSHAMQTKRIVESSALSLAEQAAAARRGALEVGAHDDVTSATAAAHELLALAKAAGGAGGVISADVRDDARRAAGEVSRLAARYGATVSSWCDPFAGEEAIAVWTQRHSGVLRHASVLLQLEDHQAFVDATRSIVIGSIPGAWMALGLDDAPPETEDPNLTGWVPGPRARERYRGPRHELNLMFNEPRQTSLFTAHVRSMAQIGQVELARSLLNHVNDMWTGKQRVVPRTELPCRFDLRICEHDIWAISGDYGASWNAALQATRQLPSEPSGWNALARTIPHVAGGAQRPGAMVGPDPLRSYIHLSRSNEKGRSAGAHLVKGHMEMIRISDDAYAMAVRRYLRAHRAAPTEPLPLLCAANASASLSATLSDPARKRRWCLVSLALLDDYASYRVHGDDPGDASTRAVLQVEVLYNRGRVLHTCGLLAAAAEAYESALRAPGAALPAALGLKRDTAHNLTRLYASNGLVEQARKTMREHLTFAATTTTAAA